MNTLFSWHGRWIHSPHGCAPSTVTPAPCFRTEFRCGKFQKAVIRLCGLGWHELYVNGVKADDRVLAPNVTQFDRRVSYIDYDATMLLHEGDNAVAVVLGNGFYNSHTRADWQFDTAPWRDRPKMCCDIFADGEIVESSGRRWKCHASPTLFDSVRNGEYYDARLEEPGFALPGFDDGAWESAELCDPPAGICVPEDEEPCRITQTYLPVREVLTTPDFTVYDFGTELSGWCRVTVEGKAGDWIELNYAEQLRSTGDITTEGIDHSVYTNLFQTDRYTLKGGGPETFMPRFTYHGFRYVRVKRFPSSIRIVRMEACFVHNDFASAGTVTTGDAVLNTLQNITRQSFRSNFVNFPTDCPTREKNGWTGDAALACRTGFWNFHAADGYRHFLKILTDAQRPSGQLPAIAPCAGWGFNWGSGPAWDNALFEGVEQLYCFTNDTESIRRHYEHMVRYLDYCLGREEDGILSFGLGDWAHWDPDGMEPEALTSTAYFYADALRLSRFAEILHKKEDQEAYLKLARRIAAAFLKEFHHGDGLFGHGSMTAQGCALYFDLAGDFREACLQKLVAEVRARKHRACFGILGAKYVPRVLAREGYADDAWKIFTQPELPGWGNWVARGATTLWENWCGKSSVNHIMFGDVSAWLFEYPGGVKPLWEAPGFRRFALSPVFPAEMPDCGVTYDSPFGRIRSAWRRVGAQIQYDCTVPEGCSAELTLPGIRQTLAAGSCTFYF